MSQTLQEKQFSDSIKEKKRWIKTGLSVRHRDHRTRKMYVDQVVKSVRKDHLGKEHTMIIGVDCHWIMASGEYGKGRFLTMELEPWEDEQSV